MDEKTLREKIIKGINNDDVSILDLRLDLVTYRDSGGSREEALKVLTEIRKSLSKSDQEDLVLDLMDFTTNFCAPHMRIWS